MPLTLSEDHIFTLSGDTGVLKDGRKLATPAKWSDVGASDEAAWGACQGSAKEPYKVAVDLGGGEPGYKCNCPSRKFPCKHAIGLLYLILNQQPAAQEPPGWASSWLAGRRQRAEAKANTASRTDSDAPSPATIKSEAAREAAREAKVRAGMEELRLWLRDLARRGLADSTIKTYEFWDRMAARLADAQASALAKRLRALAGLPFQVKTDWTTRMLDEIGRIHLLVEAYFRLDTLPPDLQEDVRTLIGWTTKKEEVEALPGLRDLWWVMGQYDDVEDRLKVRRAWVYGQRSGQTALLLAFAFGNASLDFNYTPGQSFEAELAFYPSAYPQRAVLKQMHSAVHRPTLSAGVVPHGFLYDDFESAFAAYAEALAQNPWLDRFPMGLRGALPLNRANSYVIRDVQGRIVPMQLYSGLTISLLLFPALTGGHPIPVFGEWNGYDFRLITLVSDGAMVEM